MFGVPGKPSLVGLGIGFDLDHTLIVDNKLERIAFLRLLERIVDQGGIQKDGFEAEGKRIDELLVRQRSGGMSIEDAVRLFVRDHAVTDPEPFVQQYREIAVSLVDALCVPQPYAKQVLRELHRRGAKIVVLSNGWNPLQEQKAKRLGFSGPVLTSAQLGVQKPDPQAFAALVKELALPVAKVVYVGDDPRTDIVGALAAGLRTVWMNADDASYPPGAPKPHAMITTLDDLGDALSAFVQPTL